MNKRNKWKQAVAIGLFGLGAVATSASLSAQPIDSKVALGGVHGTVPVAAQPFQREVCITDAFPCKPRPDWCNPQWCDPAPQPRPNVVIKPTIPGSSGPTIIIINNL